MTKSRSLALALAPQLLALIALAQPWFTISMLVDNSNVELGAFDGAKTFATASPLALLALAALAVAAISAAKTRLVAIALIAVSSLLSLSFLVPRILAQDVSSLDSQLDRLTGIANTHGLDEVSISASSWPFIWAALTFASLLFSIWMLRSASAWASEDKSRVSARSKSKDRRTATSIDLWDEQR